MWLSHKDATQARRYKMILALALAATVYVQPGQTLSGIAASQGASLAAVESANPQIGDPNTIYVGEAVNLPGALSALSAPSAAPSESATSSPESSFQACVISRESGGDAQVMNGSGHYGLYQFSASTWAAYGGNPADFGDASVSEQNQVFENAVSSPDGEANWSPYDGC
jgi:LysM repeat protein